MKVPFIRRKVQAGGSPLSRWMGKRRRAIATSEAAAKRRLREMIAQVDAKVFRWLMARLPLPAFSTTG